MVEINCNESIRSLDQWTLQGINSMHDVKDFLKEKINLEVDYAFRLESLVKKYIAKFDKRLNLFTDEVERVSWFEQSGVKSWRALLAEHELHSKRISLFHEENFNEVIDELKDLITHCENWRKKQLEFALNLEIERVSSIAQADKLGQKYQQQCLKVDMAKQKFETCQEEKNIAKLKKQWQKEVINYHSIKNDYLLAIEYSNTYQKKYLEQCMPAFQEITASINEFRSTSCRQICIRMNSVEEQLAEHLSQSCQMKKIAIDGIDPVYDTKLVYDAKTRSPIAKMTMLKFEKCKFIEDQPSLTLDNRNKTYLLNILLKAQEQFQVLEKDIRMRNNELDGLLKLYATYASNKDLGNPVLVYDSILKSQRQLILAKQNISQPISLISYIQKSFEDLKIDVAVAAKHPFKSVFLPLRVPCYVCQKTIWNISKSKAKTCPICNINVHAKCEMKAPFDCYHNESQPSGLHSMGSDLERTASDMNIAPISRAMTRYSASKETVNEAAGKVPGSTKPVSMNLALNLDALQLDSNMSDEDDDEYSEESLHHSTSIDWSKTLNKPSEVIALYDYTPQSEHELELKKDDVVTVVRKGADGWWEGFNRDVFGLFPSNYVVEKQGQASDQ